VQVKYDAKIEGRQEGLTNMRMWGNTATVALLLCGATVAPASAQVFTTMASFDGANGASPLAALVQGTDGNLYGVTFEGGINSYGTVFKITPGGTLTTLHSFDTSDGGYPSAALVMAANGRFYGTSQEGGVYLSGTIFRMNAPGTPMTLHSFDIGDGDSPTAGLIQDAANEAFYGTAWEGGKYRYGTVFGITPAGVLTTLHNFRGTDGANPDGNLVQADDGTFYGITENGGANCLPSGCGAIFRITPDGRLTTLHSFNRTDGAYPEAGLLQATDGDFYGTTVSGGAGNYGTVFKITPRGVLTPLHSFDGNDGAYPYSQLIQGTDGELYGTTTTTIFRITSSGALTTLYTFDYSPNGGEAPVADWFRPRTGISTAQPSAAEPAISAPFLVCHPRATVPLFPEAMLAGCGKTGPI